MRRQFQNRIISIGRDDRGNEHNIMLEADGTIKDLYREIQYFPGEFFHAYYSKFFHKPILSSVQSDITVAQPVEA